MDIGTAQKILAAAGQLVEVSSTFQARYGKDYTLKPGSPQDAWALHEAALELQCSIARLLDELPVEQPHSRYGQWWKRQDMMDTGVARELILEVSNLIACCAHHTTHEPKLDWSYSINNSQAAIAGMLHPASLQIGADESRRLNVS